MRRATLRVISRGRNTEKGFYLDLPVTRTGSAFIVDHTLTTGVHNVIHSLDRPGVGCRFHREQLVDKSGEGMLMDILLGIVGAVAGGWLFNVFGMPGVTGLNLYSFVVAVIGAAVFLIVYHAVTRRGA